MGCYNFVSDYRGLGGVFMVKVWRSFRRPVIFGLVGAFVGFLYFKIAGCPGGNCAITSDLGNTMFYTGIMGFIIGFISKGGCCGNGSCDMDE